MPPGAPEEIFVIFTFVPSLWGNHTHMTDVHDHTCEPCRNYTPTHDVIAYIEPIDSVIFFSAPLPLQDSLIVHTKHKHIFHGCTTTGWCHQSTHVVLGDVIRDMSCLYKVIY